MDGWNWMWMMVIITVITLKIMKVLLDNNDYSGALGMLIVIHYS